MSRKSKSRAPVLADCTKCGMNDWEVDLVWNAAPDTHIVRHLVRCKMCNTGSIQYLEGVAKEYGAKKEPNKIFAPAMWGGY